MKLKAYQFKVGLIIFLLNFLISSTFAQAPQKMSYQAVIRNSSNALVTSTVIGMKISVLQGSPSGTVAYSETQSPTTNANGLVSLQIGAGTVVSGTFSAINWAAGPYFIQTETDPLGGTAYSIVGTTELTSVPYALFSSNGPAGAQGPQGIQGLIGPAGANGVSVVSATIAIDSLFLSLSNSVTINAGKVTGATGPQGLAGPAGANGISVVSVCIK